VLYYAVLLGLSVRACIHLSFLNLVLFPMEDNPMAPSLETQIFFLLPYIFPSKSICSYRYKQQSEKEGKEIEGRIYDKYVE